MENKTKLRIITGICALGVLVAAGFSAAFYGTKNAAAQTILPERQAAIEEALLDGDTQETDREEAAAKADTEAGAVPEKRVVTADMPMELPTESGLHPAQEAAMELALYDLTELNNREPVTEEPVWQQSPPSVPAPAPPAPVQQAPAPQAPAPQPVLTDNQQEGCVGDGLTY